MHVQSTVISGRSTYPVYVKITFAIAAIYWIHVNNNVRNVGPDVFTMFYKRMETRLQIYEP